MVTNQHSLSIEEYGPIQDLIEFLQGLQSLTITVGSRRKREFQEDIKSLVNKADQVYAFDPDIMLPYLVNNDSETTIEGKSPSGNTGGQNNN